MYRIINFLSANQVPENFVEYQALIDKARAIYTSIQALIDDHSNYIRRAYNTSLDNTILPGHKSIPRASFDLLTVLKSIPIKYDSLNSVIYTITLHEQALVEANHITEALFRAKTLDADYGQLLSNVLALKNKDLTELLSIKQRLKELSQFDPKAYINSGIDIAISTLGKDLFITKQEILLRMDYIRQSEKLREEFIWQMPLD